MINCLCPCACDWDWMAAFEKEEGCDIPLVLYIVLCVFVLYLVHSGE